MFEYACNRRHPDCGGAPPRYILRTTNECGKYGTVGYDEHLEEETISRYGLVLIDGPFGHWEVNATNVETGERILIARYNGTGASAFFRAQREAIHNEIVVKDITLSWVIR